MEVNVYYVEVEKLGEYRDVSERVTYLHYMSGTLLSVVSKDIPLETYKFEQPRLGDLKWSLVYFRSFISDECPKSLVVVLVLLRGKGWFPTSTGTFDLQWNVPFSLTSTPTSTLSL